MIVTGGRSRNLTNILPTEVYDTETSHWYSFSGLSLYRHISFNKEHELYLYGGFRNSNPFNPLTDLEKVDFYDYFKYEPALTSKIKSYLEVKGKDENTKSKNIELNQKVDQKYKLSCQAIVLKLNEDMNKPQHIMTKIDIDKLESESKRVGGMMSGSSAKHKYNEYLVSQFIEVLLRPDSWYSEETDLMHKQLPFNRSAIAELIGEATKAVNRDSTLIKIKSPAKIFGNIFGQYDDLMRIFSEFGKPSEFTKGDIHVYSYVFLGNYVDRGKYSLEVILLLMALKAKYPDNVFLSRGSHEDREVNALMGLREDCLKRIKDEADDTPDSVFNLLNHFFDQLPLALVIDGKILCVHSGIGSSINTLADIMSIKRPVKVANEVMTAEEQRVIDLLYSEFSDRVEDFAINNETKSAKGCITIFGKRRLDKFLKSNQLQMLITSHKMCNEGYKVINENLLLVYSCTNYQDICKNKAAILLVSKNSSSVTPRVIEYEPSEKKNWLAIKSVSI